METTDVRRDISQNAQQLGRWIGLRGLLMVALGILFLVRPGTGVATLLAVFVIYCFIAGFTALGLAIRGGAMRSRGALALEGIVSFAAGILTLVTPGNAAVVLLYFIALRAVINGALEVYAAIRLGQAIPSPWLLALAGLAS